METRSSWITCDGCGLPASPEHIADRLRRLELATRFRPVHINILYLAQAPGARAQDDFYGPPEPREFFDALMDAAGIAPCVDESSSMEQREKDAVNLLEFQRKGCYLAYLSECPIPEQNDSNLSMVSTLGPTLIRRIRFNYKPKQIAPLGKAMAPIIEILKESGMGQIVALDHVQPLNIAGLEDQSSGQGRRGIPV